jgi:hypothetical protein
MPHVFSLAKSNSSTVRNRKETLAVELNDEVETEIPAETQTQQTTVTEILWKIDWVFKDMNKTLSDNCMSETKSIQECLDRFFNDTWKLGPTRHMFEGSEISCADQLDVFLITASKDELLMNTRIPIREALNGQAIIEYPIFHIRRRQ